MKKKKRNVCPALKHSKTAVREEIQLVLLTSDLPSYPCDQSAGRPTGRSAEETRSWSGTSRSSAGTHSGTASKRHNNVTETAAQLHK